jgi:hypothetical protein
MFAPIGCWRERAARKIVAARGLDSPRGHSAAATARATGVAAELAQSQLITTGARALSQNRARRRWNTAPYEPETSVPGTIFPGLRPSQVDGRINTNRMSLRRKEIRRTAFVVSSLRTGV